MKKMYKRLMILGLAVLIMLGATGAVSAASVTSGQAVRQALRDANLKRDRICALEVEYDREDGEYDIEFLRKSDRSRYDYNVSASSGRILEADVEYRHRVNRSKKKVGAGAARQKAARYARCKVDTVKKGVCKYKKDDREWVYKLRFRSGNYIYKIEVLAPTGKIIEAEKTFKSVK